MSVLKKASVGMLVCIAGFCGVVQALDTLSINALLYSHVDGKTNAQDRLGCTAPSGCGHESPCGDPWGNTLGYIGTNCFTYSDIQFPGGVDPSGIELVHSGEAASVPITFSIGEPNGDPANACGVNCVLISQNVNGTGNWCTFTTDFYKTIRDIPSVGLDAVFGDSIKIPAGKYALNMSFPSGGNPAGGGYARINIVFPCTDCVPSGPGTAVSKSPAAISMSKAAIGSSTVNLSSTGVVFQSVKPAKVAIFSLFGKRMGVISSSGSLTGQQIAREIGVSAKGLVVTKIVK